MGVLKALTGRRQKHISVPKLLRSSFGRVYLACAVLGWFLLFLNILNGGAKSLRQYTSVDRASYQQLTEKVAAPPRNNSNHSSVIVQRNQNDSNIIVSILLKNVFLYSAIAVNSTSGKDAFWDNIILSGWEHKRLHAENYSCCLVYGTSSNSVTTVPSLTKRHWSYPKRANLEVKQWVCPNVLKEVPKMVSITTKKICPKTQDAYVKVEPAYRKRKRAFGVCAKLVYGNIKASVVIEWFEFQRMMGVDTILVYTNNLNAAATKALEYYKSVGLVEIHPFELGGAQTYPRHIGVKSYQGWNDEQATVFDCQARLSGSTYIALYDLDEFIYPFKHKDYKQLLRNMTKQYPRAAGFTFKSEIYVTSWNYTQSTSGSGLITSTYTRRTEVMADRVKNFVIVDRMQPGRLSTHFFWQKKPFKKTMVPPTTAVIKHYRACRKEWLRKGREKCHSQITQVEDSSMISVADKLAPRVRHVQNTIGLIT